MSEVKRKRIPEYRRARSRAAARSRREQESRLFRELAEGLPLSPRLADNLDKASIIRLALSYLRLRALLDCPGQNEHPATFQPPDNGSQSPRAPCDEKMLDSALGGFLLLVSQGGQIIYTTEAVSAHTGINQMDLIGQSLFHFIHPCDLKEVRDILSSKTGVEEQPENDLFLRMKCTLTPLGRTVSLKSASWKVLHCTGVRKLSVPPGSDCLVLLCQPLSELVPSAGDACLNHTTFLSRHTPDMRFIYCQPRGSDLIGYTEAELQGQSVYQYCHTLDCQHILKAHLNLFSKGHVSTGKYRLLVKYGGYVWVETNAKVVYSSRSGQPQSVICINYILSEVEQSGVVFSLEQTENLLKPCLFSTASFPASRPRLDGYRGHPDLTIEEPKAKPLRETGDFTGGSTVSFIETLLDSDSQQSPQQDLSVEDLETLAPYIPMDDEDFPLSPISEVVEGEAEMGVQGPSYNLATNLSHKVQEAYGGPVAPISVTRHSQTQPMIWASFHANMLNDSKHGGGMSSGCTNSWCLEGASQGRLEGCALKRPWNEEPSSYCGLLKVPNLGKAAAANVTEGEGGEGGNCPWTLQQTAPQWTESQLDAANYPCTSEWDLSRWNSSVPIHSFTGGQVSLRSVHWAPEYGDVKNSTPTSSFQCSEGPVKVQHKTVLPVLTHMECEMSAPLGPASDLLHGAEILSALDQASFGLSHLGTLLHATTHQNIYVA